MSAPAPWSRVVAPPPPPVALDPEAVAAALRSRLQGLGPAGFVAPPAPPPPTTFSKAGPKQPPTEDLSELLRRQLLNRPEVFSALEEARATLSQHKPAEDEAPEAAAEGNGSEDKPSGDATLGEDGEEDKPSGDATLGEDVEEGDEDDGPWPPTTIRFTEEALAAGAVAARAFDGDHENADPVALVEAAAIAALEAMRGQGKLPAEAVIPRPAKKKAPAAVAPPVESDEPDENCEEGAGGTSSPAPASPSPSPEQTAPEATEDAAPEASSEQVNDSEPPAPPPGPLTPPWAKAAGPRVPPGPPPGAPRVPPGPPPGAPPGMLAAPSTLVVPVGPLTPPPGPLAPPPGPLTAPGSAAPVDAEPVISGVMAFPPALPQEVTTVPVVQTMPVLPIVQTMPVLPLGSVGAPQLGTPTSGFIAAKVEEGPKGERIYRYSLSPGADIEGCFRNVRRRIEVELEDGLTVQMCLEKRMYVAPVN